mmetsp:Transcript_40145/g.86895  ORF Transcript_40145/g.86895 Transcript_40145/m.86895 type:complete len:95 (-) Transcript_40145:62-346(-)
MHMPLLCPLPTLLPTGNGGFSMIPFLQNSVPTMSVSGGHVQVASAHHQFIVVLVTSVYPVHKLCPRPNPGLDLQCFFWRRRRYAETFIAKTQTH